MADVRFINPPNWDEIGVKNLYGKVTAQPEMSRYFPDKFPKGSQCDKSYFFNVWNTVMPSQVKQVIDHANSQRYTVKGEEVKNNSIVLT